MKKEVQIRKVQACNFLMVGKKHVQNPSRPTVAEEAKPKGGEKRGTGPKGPKSNVLRVGEKQIQKPSRPITVGKAKPKGGEKRGTDPKGPSMQFFNG